MVVAKDNLQSSSIETQSYSPRLQLHRPETEQSQSNPLKLTPSIRKLTKPRTSFARYRPPASIASSTPVSLDHYSAYETGLDNPDFSKDPNLLCTHGVQPGDTTHPASDSKHPQLVAQSFSNQIPNSSDQPFHPDNSANNILPSPSVRAKLNTFRRNPNQNMELHDASGTLLQSYSVNADSETQQQSTQQQPQQEQEPGQDQDQDQQQQTPEQQQQQQHHPQQQQSPAQNQESVVDAEQIKQERTLQQQSEQSQAHAQSSEQVQEQTQQEGERINGSGSQGGVANVTSLAAGQQSAHSAQSKKPARMPGTKQCPSCHNTIAAAVAKCPKCPHVFREKKEKVKRSGKRGKKNCPKCSYENPSACSSCKQCKYVFRLKLMDKYKAMRPRQPSDSDAAAAAAVAHAAANMGHGSTAVTAVSTVPLPAGVATYPSQLGQQVHPGHVSVMPSMPTQHAMAMHQHSHNVHTSGMPQIHPMQQHPMQPHQTHPQL